MKAKIMRTTFEVNESIWLQFIENTSYIRRDKFLSHCIDTWINHPFIRSIQKNSNTSQEVLKVLNKNEVDINRVKTNIFLNTDVSKKLTQFCKNKGITRNIFFNTLIEWLLKGARDIGGSAMGKIDAILSNPINIMENDWGKSDHLSLYRLDKIFFNSEDSKQAYLDSLDFVNLVEAVSKQFNSTITKAEIFLKDLTIEEILKVRNKPVIKKQIDLLASVSSSTELSFDDLLKD